MCLDGSRVSVRVEGVLSPLWVAHEENRKIEEIYNNRSTYGKNI